MMYTPQDHQTIQPNSSIYPPSLEHADRMRLKSTTIETPGGGGVATTDGTPSDR